MPALLPHRSSPPSAPPPSTSWPATSAGTPPTRCSSRRWAAGAPPHVRWTQSPGVALRPLTATSPHLADTSPGLHVLTACRSATLPPTRCLASCPRRGAEAGPPRARTPASRTAAGLPSCWTRSTWAATCWPPRQPRWRPPQWCSRRPTRRASRLHAAGIALSWLHPCQSFAGCAAGPCQDPPLALITSCRT